MNARDYAEQASEIFVLSDSFVRIKELIDDESSTIDDISEVIILDPALTATILKLANSSFFNYPGKIDSVSKAMLVLGITEVYNLVIAYYSTEAFRKINANKDFLDDFWERSVDCALLIKYLGGYLSVPNSERLFILGLLHSVGELVLQQLAPEKLAQCYQFAEGQTPWHKQQQVFGFTFAQVSAELLKFWGLPYCLIDPIYNQDEEDFKYLTDESKVLFLSKRLKTYNFYYAAEPLDKVLSAEQMQQLGVNETVLHAASDYCDLERLSILITLKPSASVIY